MLSEIDENISIKASGLGKCYLQYHNPADRLKQLFLRKRRYYEESWVLKDISFELPRGKALGVIGKNGAGKSTLLQILTGTLTPTTGEVYLRGKVAALLELGSGFNPEFSGRDNIYVNAAILGLTKNQINERFEDIVAFSELGDHIEQPVKTYSSGMYVRLAFSVQVCVNPDILIVDEALAVGDVFFQQKCHARMEKLLEQGTSILLVSHDTSAIRKYCDTSLLLEDGRNVFYGDVETAVSKYFFQSKGKKKNLAVTTQDSQEKSKNRTTPVSLERRFKSTNGNSSSKKSSLNDNIHTSKLLDIWPDQSRHIDLSQKEVVGDGCSASFKSAALCGEDGLPRDHFTQGEWIYLFWELELLRDFEVPIGGLTIFSSSNLPLFCKGTFPPKNEPLTPANKGCLVRFGAAIKTNIAIGDYIIKLSLAEMTVDTYCRLDKLSSAEYINSTIFCIQIPKAFILKVQENTDELPFFGLVDLPNSLEILVQQ